MTAMPPPDRPWSPEPDPIRVGGRGDACRIRRRGAPQRTCVACRQRDTQGQLLRLVMSQSGELSVDLRRRVAGRGTWIHRRGLCLSRAPRTLGRSLGTPGGVGVSALQRALRDAAAEIIGTALRRACRMGCIHPESAAARGWLGLDSTRFCILSNSVSAALPGVQKAVADGRAQIWGSASSLGRLLGCEATDVLAISDTGVASCLRLGFDLSRLAEFPCSGDRPRDISEVG